MVENSLQVSPIPPGSFFRRRSRKNVLLVGDAAGFTDALNKEGICFNMARALKKPSTARDLASLLCHQKSKIGLLF